MIRVTGGLLIGGSIAGINTGSIIGNQPTTVIPDIDMTAAALDSRVVYSGPAHSFFNKAGGISQCAADVWPLEYRNGTPVGRHEPEPQATNYLASSEFQSIGPVGGQTDWIYSAGANIVTGQGDLGLICAFSASTAKNTAVYNETAAAFTASPLFLSTGTEWIRFIRKATNPSAAINRAYIARVDANVYLYGKTPVNVPAGSYTASGYRKTSGNNLLSCLPQLELGNIATSPILSGQGATATRAASSAFVLRDGAATGAVLYFSNGDTVQIDFNGADRAALPLSAADWGTRYLKTISYRK